MSAPTGRSGLAPGDCLAILTQLDKHRKRGLCMADLPPRSVEDLNDTLDAVRGFMTKDPHVGPLLEGAMDRIDKALDFGSLAQVQAMDLRTVRGFLLAVPTVRRL